MVKLLSLSFLILVLLLGACTAAPQPTRTPQPTPKPTSTLAPTMVARGVANGERLFHLYQPQVGFACVTCHYADLDKRLIGPGMKGLSARFVTYELDLSLDDYIRQSILHPNEFLALGDPPYVAGVMPPTYAEVFTEAELEDLIAYLKSL